MSTESAFNFKEGMLYIFNQNGEHEELCPIISAEFFESDTKLSLPSDARFTIKLNRKAQKSMRDYSMFGWVARGRVRKRLLYKAVRQIIRHSDEIAKKGWLTNAEY